LAWAYNDSGRTEDAISLFEELFEKELARKIFTGFAFDELVKIFKQEKTYDRMVGICEKAFAAQPEDTGLLFTLGDAYMMNGMPVKAIEVFKKIILMEPDASSCFMSLGNAQVASGDFTGAEEAYAQASSIDPFCTDVYQNRLGMTYLRAGEYARAKTAFQKAVDYKSDEPVYHCNLGDVLVLEGRLDEAETAYETASALKPEARSVYLNRLGNTLYQEKRYLKAIVLFKKAVAMEPENPFYHIHLARSYEAAGFPAEAQKEIEKAESLK
jgi:tetratricopeptide (TPR) repeat protein